MSQEKLKKKLYALRELEREQMAFAAQFTPNTKAYYNAVGRLTSTRLDIRGIENQLEELGIKIRGENEK